MTRGSGVRVGGAVALALISAVLAIPVQGERTPAQKKQLAQTYFEKAERMREALNGRPAAQRSKRDYNRVVEAYRAVYYTSPASNRADASVVAVAELLAEAGRQFKDDDSLRASIGQFKFLRREYPGSRYRVQALFTIAQIYNDDLNDTSAARAAFQEFLERYPRSELAADARAAIRDIEHPAREAQKSTRQPAVKTARDEASQDTDDGGRNTLVTGIRHWSTPDYTRIAIDLQDQVHYDSERIDHPDRVYFDLHNTRLSSTLKGKSFDVEDGLLRKIRIAQFQASETRVVLELDQTAEYSAFLLPNPYRLIIDVHGKHPQKMAKAEPPAPKAAPREAGTQAKATAEAEPAKSVKASARKETPRDSTVQKISDDAADAKRGRKPSFDELSAKVAKLNSEDGDSDAESSAASGKRGKIAKKGPEAPAGHEAKPTANGERSLIRALGLKIGRIVVDAGHGGHDTGTIGPNGLMEKDLVLEVALRLGKLLQTRMGAEVVYTRDDDTFVPLETRTAVANQNQADLFISIHANSSSDASARGVETYYLNFTSSADALEVAARENAVSEKSIHELQDLVKKIALKDKIEESHEFAADVQKALYSGLAGQGLRNRGVKKAPFIVLIGANMPSILAEISFVSNPTDARKLRTAAYRQRIAEALYHGTAKYVSGLSGLKVASKARPEPTAAAVRSNSGTE